MKTVLKDFEKHKDTDLIDKQLTRLIKAVRTSSHELLRLRLSLKLIIPFLAIALFSVYSFAENVGVTTTSIQSESGVLFNVNGSFTSSNNSFSVVQNTFVPSMQPVPWTSNGTVKTALTAGNWFYALTLTITEKAEANHTYTITVMWDTGSGYSALGALTVTSPSTITAGQTMDFYFDTGQTSFNAPAAIVVIPQ